MEGDTPLHLAVMQEVRSEVEELIEAKTDKSIQNVIDKTPFNVAREINNKEEMNMLEPEYLKSESTRIGEEHSAQSQHSEPPVFEASEETGEKVLQDQESVAKNAYRPKADEYKTSIARIRNHGTLYQLRLLMLFLLRALKNNYVFQLGTEVDEAEQFDDIVFEYVKPPQPPPPPTTTTTVKKLFLQAKLVAKAGRRLKLIDLFSSHKSAPFCLYRYYKSYLKIKDTYGGKVDEIEFAICTNTLFDFNDNFHLNMCNKGVTLTFKEHTSELYEDFFKEGKCYKLVTNDIFVDFFVSEYQNYDFKYNPYNRSMEEDTVDRMDVIKFVNNLTFVVDFHLQTDKKIINEYRAWSDSNFLDIGILIDSFKNQMNNWYTERNGTYLTRESVAEMITPTVNKVDNFSVSGISRQNIEELLKYPIVFNDDIWYHLCKMIDYQKIVNVTGQTKTKLNAVKVAQALKKSGEYNENDSYIFINIDSLLIEEIRNLVFQAFNSIGSHDLLVINCLSQTKYVSETELRSLKKDLLKITDANDKKKMVVIAPEKHPLTDLLKICPDYNCGDVTTVFQDFTSETQNDLLATKVKFQGQDVELRKVIEAKTDLLDSAIFESLICDEGLVIGTDLPTPFGYNKSFYIRRIVKITNPAKLDSFQADSQNEIAIQVLKSEVDYNQKCFGPTKEVVPLNEKDFLNLVEPKRVVIISDSAGMGKTTVLTHFSKQIKKDDPGSLVYIIDLNYKTKELQEQRTQFDHASALDFLCNKLIVPTTPYEKELLSKKSKVVLLFDGFDEISQNYNDVVLDLIEKIQESTQAQIWITTRPFMTEELENKLSEVSFSLESFKEPDQVDFLMKFWKYTNDYQIDDKLKSLAYLLVKQLSCSISDNERKCSGIPLQLKLLAENLNDDLFNYCITDFYSHGLISLVDLYEKFIIKKFEKSIMGHFGSESIRLFTTRIQDQIAVYMKSHQWYACCMILSAQIADLLLPGDCGQKTQRSTLNNIGILKFEDGKFLFLHRTIAEYLVADLIKEVINRQKSDEIYEFVLFELLTVDAYMAVRTFLNGLLAKSKPKEEALIELGNRISLSHKTKKDKIKDVFLRTAEDGSHRILDFLCDCLQKLPTLLMELLLCANIKTKRTMLHLAAENDDNTLLNILQKKTSDENEQSPDAATKILVKDWLQASDIDGTTSLHVAAKLGHLEFMLTLMKWPLERLDKGQDIVRNMLNAADKDGKTALHLAAEEGHDHLIKTLLQWSKDNLGEEGQGILRCVLLKCDRHCRTVLHLAAEKGQYPVIQTVMQWTRSNYRVEQYNTILTDLIEATDNLDRTVLHLLAKQGNEITVLTLLRWIYDNLNIGLEIVKGLLIHTDDDGRTAIAAKEGNDGPVDALLFLTD